MMITKVTLDTKEAAMYLSVSYDFLKKARVSGKGPIFSKLGKKVVYKITDLESYLNENSQRNTCYI